MKSNTFRASFQDLPPEPFSMEDSDGVERLPDWDQVAVRGYFQVALCFPFDGHSTQDAVQHVEVALGRLAMQCPQLSGSLFLGDGAHAHHVFLRRCSQKIPLETIDLTKDYGGTPYHVLRAQGFPPGVFVHPAWGLDGTLRAQHGGNGAVPVSRVRLGFVPGGLFLWIYLHHSLGDGHCLGMLIDDLAAQTHGDAEIRRRRVALQLPARARDDRTPEALLKACPEYVLLPSPTGPTAPAWRPDLEPMGTVEQTGKNFVFATDRLEELRSLVYAHTDPAFLPRPTVFTCLAALAWVHITRARLEIETVIPPQTHGRDAKLLIPIDWSRRCFADETADYFGNTAATLAIEVSGRELGEAYGSLRGLARVVQKIAAAIHSVGQAWVEDRTALFQKLPDPRLLGLHHDPRRPQELHFTTWRHYGADARWHIPGVPTDRPEAVRRGQARWGAANALILPARTGSPVYELLVTLPVGSMAALHADDEWMAWVDQVAGVQE